MRLKQISVFLENKAGRLAEVTKLLGESGINLRALSLADTIDFGVLRLIVDDPEKALEVLRENGFTASQTDVLGVEVPDRPGGLANILQILAPEGINVEYMYAFVEKSGDNALVVFRVEDVDRTVGVLQRAGVKLVGGDEIYKL
jgi:hypothetical protein